MEVNDMARSRFEKPIIFCTEMVREIAAERKVMTRRVRKSEDEKPKYGHGDILWVRETFADCGDGAYLYRADDENIGYIYLVHDDGRTNPLQWKPSIHMPFDAAKRFLYIVEPPRIERLQDITEDDARMEGVGSVSEFRELWDSLNAGRGYGWDTNPSVFVYHFGLLVNHKPGKLD
jgi:hypothetical protein